MLIAIKTWKSAYPKDGERSKEIMLNTDTIFIIEPNTEIESTNIISYSIQSIGTVYKPWIHVRPSEYERLKAIINKS